VKSVCALKDDGCGRRSLDSDFIFETVAIVQQSESKHGSGKAVRFAAVPPL